MIKISNNFNWYTHITSGSRARSTSLSWNIFQNSHSDTPGCNFFFDQPLHNSNLISYEKIINRSNCEIKIKNVETSSCLQTLNTHFINSFVQKIKWEMNFLA